MKKTLVSIILFLVVIAIIIVGVLLPKDEKETTLTKITVADATITSRPHKIKYKKHLNLDNITTRFIL